MRASPQGGLSPKSSRVKFTKMSVPRLTCPQDRDTAFYWDASLPGFGLCARPSGLQTWVVQFRTCEGKSRRITLGDTRTVPLAKAREKAGEHLSRAKLGADPQAEKTAARKAVRLSELVEKYLPQARSKLRHRSFLEVERHLTKHAKPLHGAPVSGIDRADITRLLNSVSQKNGPIAANRVRAALSALWTWGLRSGYIAGDNPVAYVPMPAKEKQRERVLTDEELALIWRCTSSRHDYTRIVRLLMLTGARRDEVGQMQWSEIFPAHAGACSGKPASLWVLPRERTKNGLPHEVPLTALARSQLPAADDGSAVFGRGGTGFSGWSKAKARLDEQMREALREDFVRAHGREPAEGEAVLMPWTLHDMRRTFSTWCNENGVEPHIVEALLNHVSGAARRGVAGVYNRAVYREQKLEALERWAAQVRRLADATEARDAKG